MGEREDTSYFIEANLDGPIEELPSPSGQYRLLVRSYRTAPGRGNYSRGTVVRVSDGAIVCDQRDFGAFHHSWVVKDGRELLIAGRSYMTQTIVDLDRSLVYEHTPSNDNFCWARCELSPDGQTLLVDGCYWACPYELRFFDFSDPSRGWPALSVIGAGTLEEPSDRVAPRWLDGETVECSFWDISSVPNERVRLRRRGSEMVVLERWVSDAETARREAEARKDAEQDAWWAEFTATDAMYARLVELLRTHDIPGELHIAGDRGIGQHFRRQHPRASADLRWDTETKRLELQLYTDLGSLDRRLSFEHSVAGIEAMVAELFRAFSRG